MIGNQTPTWQNWSGFVSSNPEQISSPKDQQQLIDTLKQAAQPIRFVGSGHSFTPLVPSDGTIVSLAAFSGLINHDSIRCTATVGAGTPLNQLTTLLYDINQALQNMGDIDRQTIAGALGTATHGTGHTLGAYHTFLRSMTFVDGTGQVKIFNAGTDDELLHATGVTLGVFGALTEVTIQNIPPYRLNKQRRAIAVTDLLDQFEHLMTSHRTSEFFVIPFSSHALYLSSDISEDPLSPRPPEEDEDGLATLKLLRDWVRWFPWLRRKLIGSALSKLPPENYVQDWLNVYTSERTSRFNEMEYHLPFEEGAKALKEIIELIETHFPNVYFPMEVRAVAADEFWLSPFYKRPTCSIAIHHRAGEDPVALFKAAENIFRRYGGRPHWGKMHNLTANELSAMYPRFSDAMEVRRSMDPDNIFMSPYLRQLME